MKDINNFIFAKWVEEDNSWCEFCESTSHDTYYPFYKGVKKPERVCVQCVKSKGYTVVDQTFSDNKEYKIALSKLN